MSRLNVNQILNLLGEDLIAKVAASVIPTGEIKPWVFTSNPSGWVALDGTTVGNASSGATGRANSDTESLFTLLWNDSTNSELPIQDSAGAGSTRGVSAAADFAANKRMPLPDFRGLVARGVGTSQINARNKAGPSAVREKQEDAFQGHWHNFRSYGGSTGTGSWNFTNTTYQTNQSGATRAVQDAIDDGVNGTPRTGAETRVASYGARWIMKL